MNPKHSRFYRLHHAQPSNNTWGIDTVKFMGMASRLRWREIHDWMGQGWEVDADLTGFDTPDYDKMRTSPDPKPVLDMVDQLEVKVKNVFPCGKIATDLGFQTVHEWMKFVDSVKQYFEKQEIERKRARLEVMQTALYQRITAGMHKPQPMTR